MKLPRILQGRPGSGVDVLEYELFQEKAATLARMGAKLKTALDELAAYDAVPPKHADPAARAELVAAAGEALWYYVVQREVCGLRDTQTVLRGLGVPREVQLKMGMRPKQ
ncbi:MAG TPA: DUF6665 family protein [Longimicrobium sp.]|nr:DUF6665 family protein [Longimicrobium sp.]